MTSVFIQVRTLILVEELASVTAAAVHYDHLKGHQPLMLSIARFSATFVVLEF